MSRAERRPPRAVPVRRLAPRGHLRKEESDRLDHIRTKLLASRGRERPDVQSTMDLMYLRILSRVKDRGPVEADLKDLESLLNRAAAKMTKIMDEAEKQKASK